MKEDTPDNVDSYQRELSERIDDGGGCVEMWESANELWAADVPGGIGRRSVITAAATALGLGAAGVAQLTGTARAARDDIEVEELAGRRQKAAIGAALSDPRIKQIRKAFIENGWTPKPGDCRATLTRGPELDEEYRTVVIPFKTRASNEQAVVLWTEAEELAPQGLHSIRRTPEGEEPFWTLTHYRVEGGSVVTETEELENFLGCDSVNWGCVALIAGTYAAIFGSCAICSSTLTPPACALCIAAVLGNIGTIETCPWCGD